MKQKSNSSTKNGIYTDIILMKYNITLYLDVYISNLQIGDWIKLAIIEDSPCLITVNKKYSASVTYYVFSII